MRDLFSQWTNGPTAHITNQSLQLFLRNIKKTNKISDKSNIQVLTATLQQLNFSMGTFTSYWKLTISGRLFTDTQTIKFRIAKLNMGESIYGSITPSIIQLTRHFGPIILNISMGTT